MLIACLKHGKKIAMNVYRKEGTLQMCRMAAGLGLKGLKSRASAGLKGGMLKWLSWKNATARPVFRVKSALHSNTYP